MTNLRREFRSQLTRGAWVYAVVESVSLGKATVRLATNGARLTNCPILGAEVAVGEKVVVDYSAEGQPIVRPYTIKGTEPPEEPEEPAEAEPQPTSWCFAKYTLSDQTINDYGGVKVYLVDSGGLYLDPGFAYGSYSGQYRYTSNFWNTIPFDEALIDNIGIRNPALISAGNPGGLGYFNPPAGTYLITLCIALDITGNDLTHMSYLGNFDCSVSGNIYPHTGNGNQSAHVNKREQHAIWRMTWFAKYEGTYWSTNLNRITGHIRFSGMLDGGGGNVYSYTNLPSRTDISKATYLKLAKRSGIYPVVEFYKVADIGSNKTAIPYWNWEHYDYPDG